MKLAAETLPEKNEAWLVAVRPLDILLPGGDGKPYKPFGIFIVNADNGTGRRLGLSQGEPSAEVLAETVLSAMISPPKEYGFSPGRPRSLVVIDPTLVETLGPALSQAGLTIRIEAELEPEGFQELVAAFNARLRADTPPTPGLSTVAGVAPHLLADFYRSAAEFYRAGPWRSLQNGEPLQIHYPVSGSPWYLFVVGAEEQGPGAVAFARWADAAEQMKQREITPDSMPGEGMLTLFYESQAAVPSEDLAAIAEHEWDIAGESAFPILLAAAPGGRLRPPTREEVAWMTVALRVTTRIAPRFAAVDIRETLVVPFLEGEARARVCYPATAELQATSDAAPD